MREKFPPGERAVFKYSRGIFSMTQQQAEPYSDNDIAVTGSEQEPRSLAFRLISFEPPQKWISTYFQPGVMSGKFELVLLEETGFMGCPGELISIELVAHCKSSDRESQSLVLIPPEITPGEQIVVNYNLDDFFQHLNKRDLSKLLNEVWRFSLQIKIPTSGEKIYENEALLNLKLGYSVVMSNLICTEKLSEGRKGFAGIKLLLQDKIGLTHRTKVRFTSQSSQIVFLESNGSTSQSTGQPVYPYGTDSIVVSFQIQAENYLQERGTITAELLMENDDGEFVIVQTSAAIVTLEPNFLHYAANFDVLLVCDCTSNNAAIGSWKEVVASLGLSSALWDCSRQFEFDFFMKYPEVDRTIEQMCQGKVVIFLFDVYAEPSSVNLSSISIAVKRSAVHCLFSTAHFISKKVIIERLLKPVIHPGPKVLDRHSGELSGGLSVAIKSGTLAPIFRVNKMIGLGCWETLRGKRPEQEELRRLDYHFQYRYVCAVTVRSGVEGYWFTPGFDRRQNMVLFSVLGGDESRQLYNLVSVLPMQMKLTLFATVGVESTAYSVLSARILSDLLLEYQSSIDNETEKQLMTFTAKLEQFLESIIASWGSLDYKRSSILELLHIFKLYMGKVMQGLGLFTWPATRARVGTRNVEAIEKIDRFVSRYYSEAMITSVIVELVSIYGGNSCEEMRAKLILPDGADEQDRSVREIESELDMASRVTHDVKREVARPVCAEPCYGHLFQKRSEGEKLVMQFAQQLPSTLELKSPL